MICGKDGYLEVAAFWDRLSQMPTLSDCVGMEQTKGPSGSDAGVSHIGSSTIAACAVRASPTQSLCRFMNSNEHLQGTKTSHPVPALSTTCRALRANLNRALASSQLSSSHADRFWTAVDLQWLVWTSQRRTLDASVTNWGFAGRFCSRCCGVPGLLVSQPCVPWLRNRTWASRGPLCVLFHTNANGPVPAS